MFVRPLSVNRSQNSRLGTRGGLVEESRLSSTATFASGVSFSLRCKAVPRRQRSRNAGRRGHIQGIPDLVAAL